MKRWGIWGAVAVGVLILSCGGKAKSEQGVGETAVAGPATLRDVISQTGEVRAVVNVDLKCEASGKIEKVFVREGERVAKGQKILEIDPQRLKRRKQQLMLDIEDATIRLGLAKRNYKNSSQLAEAGTVSRTTLEDLKSEYELKDIALRQKKLDLEDINEELDKTTVTAPMDGVITTLSVDEGEIAVSATSGYQGGTQIATISDINHLEVISQIGEVDYVHLSKGQTVGIRPEALEGVETRGTVDFISLTAKKKNNDELGTFEVRVAVDSVVAGLVPGVNVNVEFVVLEESVPVAVPFYMVKKGPRGRTVAVIGSDGKIEHRKVEVGRTDYKKYEIVSGVVAGEKVTLSVDKPEKSGKPGTGGGRRGG